MNLKLLSTLFFVACLAACQAPTDTAAEVSASAAVPSEASVAAGGPGGKDSITTSEARAKQPKPVSQALGANACAELSGKTFQSVAQYEMGRTPNGTVQGLSLIHILTLPTKA